MNSVDIISATVAILIYLVLLLLIILAGISWSKGKGAFLIAGYNTASKEEKQQFDEKKLCKYMAKLAFANAFFLIVILPIIYVSIHFSLIWILYIYIGVYIAMNIYAAIHSTSLNKKIK